MASATYTKLRNGDWGIRATCAVKGGDKITVTKRDGTIKTEIVGAVIWSGDSATIATIGRSVSPSRRMGPGHGSAAPVSGYASYCTDNDYCRCFDCAS